MHQKKKDSLLIVISGPSGVGKGTISRAIISRYPNTKFSVSATTRSQRSDEIEGIHYFFKTRNEFESMIENDEFLEYMQVYGANYYGTLRRYVEEELALGFDILLDIDVNGAMKVKETYPDGVFIFIAPPSMGELRHRLLGRASESMDSIERRLQVAEQEIMRMQEYDYIVINDIIDKAVAEVASIILAEKCKVARRTVFLDFLQKGEQSL